LKINIKFGKNTIRLFTNNIIISESEYLYNQKNIITIGLLAR
jgi:hypothetical protein